MGNCQSAVQRQLKRAILKRDHQAVKRAIQDGADINQTFDKCPIIWYAAKNSSSECLEVLLDNGGHVNMRCPKSGAALLHCASTNTMAKLLLERNADINHKDMQGNNAAHYLLQRNKMSIAVLNRLRLLIKHGINLEDRNLAGYKPMDYFLPEADRQYLAEVIDGRYQIVGIL
jgi:ankyrin repeat protein